MPPLNSQPNIVNLAIYTLYSAGNVVIFATPESIAACDTARATIDNNLGSIGLGNTYCEPKLNDDTLG
jgi:hypothetical protein